MMYNLTMAQTTFEKILGLSHREQKIYNGIHATPRTVAEIARAASVPRMTAHYCLLRLLERGVIERVKRDGYFLYRRIPQEKLFMNALPQSEMPAGVLTIPITKDTETVVYRGLQDIYKRYENICRENAHQRVRCIQTTESTRHIVNDFSRKEVDHLNALISKNKIICDVIVEEDIFDPMFAKFQKDGKGAFEKYLGVFLDRISVTYVLPKHFISFKNDMLLFKDVAMFIDWEKQIAVELRNKEIVRMCLDLFETFKTHARRVEYKDMVQKYLQGPTL